MTSHPASADVTPSAATFEHLLRQCAVPAFHLAHAMLGDAHHAEDAVQEAAVENTLFGLQPGGDVGQTMMLDWRSGQVLYARSGWGVAVRARPGSADLALSVELTNPSGELAGPVDLVIVPTAGPPLVLPGLMGLLRRGRAPRAAAVRARSRAAVALASSVRS